MSNKTKLNEYCQEKRLNSPHYTSYSSGLPHQLKWNSKVSLILADNQMLTAECTQSQSTKTAAESIAALNLLQILKTQSRTESVNDLNVNTMPTNNINNFKIIYLIDLENISACNKKLNPNHLYIGFLSSTHNSVCKYTDWTLCESHDIKKNIDDSKCNKLLYLAEGGNKDLVDHFLSAFLYPLVNFVDNQLIDNQLIESDSLNPNVTIYIVSGDNAGWCTNICLKQILKWNNMTRVNVSNTNILPI